MSNKPTLLDRLQATVDDPAIFDLRDIMERDAMASQFREIFADLLTSAWLAWRGDIEDEDDPEYGLEPKHPGAEMFEVYPLLPTDWLDDFRRAITAIAEQPGIKGTIEERFLWFMEGYLMCGWDERIRQVRKKLEMC